MNDPSGVATLGTAPVQPEGKANAEPSTSDRLLDVASALFWKKGFAATSTREIALEIGIRQASIYHHVANKEDLLYRICVTSLEHFLGQVDLTNQGDPVQQIQALIAAHVNALLRHQAWNVTMLTELRSLSRKHRTAVVALRENYGGSVLQMIEAGQGMSLIRSDIPAKYLCFSLLDLLNWTALWFRQDHHIQPSQLATILSQIFLEGATLPGVRQRPTEESRSTGQTSPKRPKNPASEGMLDRLVAAAVTRFSHSGYVGTSTREVAALLGIQKASLYYHIQGKEDLLYIICKSSSEKIHATVKAALDDVTDPLDRLRQLILSHMASMLPHSAQHRITFGEMKSLSAHRLAEVLALRRSYESFVRGVITECQVAGVVRTDITSHYLCRGLMGMMNRSLVWYRPGGPLSAENVGEILASVFLFGTLPRAAT
jgi:TetR/AcrR family transcriptional regulator, cholesterol catabolism regulator